MTRPTATGADCGQIRFVEETASTNADQLARVVNPSHCEEGDWLVAACQTDGRGRSGRHWESRVGNFHGSTLVRLWPGDPPPQTLALAVAIATFDAISSLPSAPQGLVIKWPNDLLIGDAKVAGILLERNGDWVVCGVGCNLAFAPTIEQRRATALSDHGCVVTATVFAEVLAESMVRELARWRQLPLATLIGRWTDRALPRGTALHIAHGPHAGLTGTFERLEQDGSLIVRTAHGTMQTIIAGEVNLAAEGDE